MNKKTIFTILLALVALTTFGQVHGLADTYWRNEQTGDWLTYFQDRSAISAVCCVAQYL